MNIDWDILVNAVVLIVLGLFFLSKLTKQTIPELIHGIKDFITGRSEDIAERGEDLAYYD